MKKKTCRWLDSNIWGGIQILDDAIIPCCGQGKAFYHEENLDYSKISIEELIAKRKELQEKINEGTACQGCEEIIEKEESDINVDKISYLSIGLFSTCNLRCKYCYFTHEQLSDKLTPEKTHLLPFVKRLSEHNMLKDDVCIGIAGGEPTLLEDIPETLAFLKEKYPNPSLNLLSNSSVSSRVDRMISKMKDNKLYKTLYTSIDAGTSNTYKQLRGRDLFNDVSRNLLKYAKENIFNIIRLKYILMFDHSNTSDKDIFGFLWLFYKVMKKQRGMMSMTIDCDMLSKEPFDKEMIAAGGKLYYAASQIFGVEIAFCGGGLVHNTKLGQERIKLIEDYANQYKEAKKSLYEKLILSYFKISVSFNNFLKCFKIFKRIYKMIKILYFQ